MPEEAQTDVVETETVTAETPITETVKGEPFDAARAMKTIETLRAELKESKSRAKKADELEAAERTRKEAEMTELEKLQAKLAAAETALKANDLKELRRQAALKYELPEAFHSRLQGATLEELEKDAEQLSKALPKKTLSVNPTNPGGNAVVGETYEQKRARIHGQTVDPWDPTTHRGQGGGVFYQPPEEGGKS